MQRLHTIYGLKVAATSSCALVAIYSILPKKSFHSLEILKGTLKYLPIRFKTVISTWPFIYFQVLLNSGVQARRKRVSNRFSNGLIDSAKSYNIQRVHFYVKKIAIRSSHAYNERVIF